MIEHQPSSSTGQGAPSGLQSAPPARLRVIDDDASICTLIGKIGERAGYTATHAASFEEATRLLQLDQFDCITLDLNLGKKNGVEVLRVLAGMACMTPIIVISGANPTAADLAASVGNPLPLNLLQPIGKPINFPKLRVALAGIKQELDQRRNRNPAG